MGMQMNLLEDATAYFQYGQEVETEYLSFSMSSAKPSAWINFPTEDNPSSRYKYLSVEINFDMDLMSW